MEAKILYEGWGRLLPAGSPVGCQPQNLARLQGPAQHRLVGAVLSRRQCQAPHGPALRWLPFRQLRYKNKEPDRVECRLRKVSWTRKRARAEPWPDDHRQPA